MSKYAVLLGQVTIDSSNNVIRFVEGSTTADVTIAPGTYFLRGDGASGDLCPAIVDAFEDDNADAAGNTYAVTITRSVDPTLPAATVTVTRATGAGSFSILWSHANTTFDPALLGFEAEDTTHDATAKASTLSPSALWVAPDVLTFYEPEEEYDVSVLRAQSGRLRGQRTGGPLDLCRVSMDFIDAARVLVDNNLGDVDATFARFHRRNSDGKRMEFHAVDLSSGSTLAALSGSTEIGDCWHFDEDTAVSFEPERLEPGLAVYRIDLGLMGFVA